MENKELKIGNKTFIVYELLATEFDEVIKLPESDRISNIVKKSLKISDDEYSKITIRERSKIMETINILNGWSEVLENFQNTETTEKTQ